MQKNEKKPIAQQLTMYYIHKTSNGKRLQPTERTILFFLSDCISAIGKWYISYERLAQECNISLSTIKRLMPKLIKSNLLKIISYHGKQPVYALGDDLINAYNIHKCGTADIVHHEHDVAQSDTASVSHRDRHIKEENNINNNINNKRSFFYFDDKANNTDNINISDTPVEISSHKQNENEITEVFEEWKRVHELQSAVLDKPRTQKIVWALQHYSRDEISLAIRGIKRAEWWMKANRTDIKNIFSEASNTEQFINLARKSQKNFQTSQQKQIVETRPELVVVVPDEFKHIPDLYKSAEKLFFEEFKNGKCSLGNRLKFIRNIINQTQTQGSAYGCVNSSTTIN